MTMKRWPMVALATLWWVASGAACSKSAPPPQPMAPPTAPPPPQPEPAPLAATPTAVAPPAPLPQPATVIAAPPAQAATPASLGPPALHLPDAYAPLFTVGNAWRYEVTELDGERNPTGTMPVKVVCRIASVTPFPAGLVSNMQCDHPKRLSGMYIEGHYVAQQSGLVRSLDSTTEAAWANRNVAPLVANPPRPLHTKQGRGEDYMEDHCDLEVRRVVGLGAVEVVRLWGSDDTVEREEWFAPGVGLAYVMAYGGEPSQYQEFKLLSFEEAAPPAAAPTRAIPERFSGKPRLGSALPAMLAAGLKCAESLTQLTRLGGAARADAAPSRVAVDVDAGANLLGEVLRRLPSGWVDSASDVRPYHAVHKGPPAKGSCKLTIETYGGRVARIGSSFAAKPGALAGLTALGPASDHVELPKGSTLDVFEFADAVLAVYQPAVAKPEFEWWLYDPRTWPQVAAPDAAIWQAYAYNDFAIDGESPLAGVAAQDVVAAYQQAVTLVPHYGHAWLRLAKFLAKTQLDPVLARRAAGEALKSQIGGIGAQAHRLLGQLP